MPTVDLDLQLKFLNELDEALKDALSRYSDDTPEKKAELKYMQSEVMRARRIVAERMTSDQVEQVTSKSRNFEEAPISGAAYS